MSPRRATTAPNLRNYAVTREQWDKMLAAYRQHPTIKVVMEAGDVGKRIARRAVMVGWPDLQLPPFVKLLTGGSSVHKEMAIYRESWQEAAVTKGEAARQAAGEALAARTAMQSATAAAEIAQTLAKKLLKFMGSDDFEFSAEDFNLKLVGQVVRALDTSTAALQKATKIEQMCMGGPEQVLGIEVMQVIGLCNPEELQAIASSGEIPSRLLDQRRRVIDVMAESDAEAKALAVDAEPEPPPGIPMEALHEAQETPEDEDEQEDWGIIRAPLAAQG